MKTGCRSITAMWVILLVLVSGLLCAGGEREAIKVYGASIFTELVQGLGKAFMKEHPNVRVQVLGRSSEFGFLALLDKEANLAMLAREATVVEKALAKRKGIQLKGELVAWESVAVICHPGVGVTELTVGQLRKIYDGDYKNWRDLGGADQPIMLHGLAYPQGDLTVWFLHNVLSKADFTSGIIWVDTAHFLVQHVNVHRGSVAYLGNLQLTSVLKRQPQLKVQILRIRANSGSPAFDPSPEVSKKGGYPLNIPLFFFWNENNPDKRAEEFSQFCRDRLQRPVGK
jgi:phosphate transport system substrate-binding protein